MQSRQHNATEAPGSLAQGQAPRSATRHRASTTQWRGALAVVALAVVALAPRLAGLPDFITTDEAYHWVARSERFAAAVAGGDWARTLQTGHPGVTTMWLGSLGLALERAGLSVGAGSPPAVAHLAMLRLPGALLEALLIPLAYLLLLRLVRPATALAAAVMWACSPYLISHARVLHLDGLLTSFVTLSVLLLMVATRGGARPAGEGQERQRQAGARLPPLIASGVFAGLALLTKGPALILLPFAGLLLLFTAGDGWRAAWPALMRHWLFVIRRYLTWLGVALLTVLLLWPALWVDPGSALGQYVEEIVSNGGRPNGDGQFFLGRAVADPGPLFYPLADLFRTTPAMLLGLLALPLALRRRGSERRALLALGALVLFWTLVMTLGPKKFDRYVLPTWPALLVLAGAGLAALYERVQGLVRGAPQAGGPGVAGGALLPVLPVLLLAAELSQPALYHPYYLSYYNPLLGGGRAAQRLFLIGWGEGMDQVGAFLRGRPDIGYGPVLSALGPTLQPFVPVDVRDVEDFGSIPANYAVVYLESVQRAANPALYDALQQTVALHTVTIHGIDYAQIYQLPRPFAQPVGAQFGDGLLLRGVTIERGEGQLIVTPAWDVRATPAGDYRAFVHLIDARGVRVQQIDVAPGGGSAPPTDAWRPGEQFAVPLPLALPDGLPPGEYRLVMGLYDATSNARIPFTGGAPADPAYAGGDALLLGVLALP